MHATRPAKLLALAFSLGFAVNVEATKRTSGQCYVSLHKYLDSTPKTKFTDLPTVLDASLPPSFIERIQQSALYQKLKSFRDKHQRIVLDAYQRGITSLSPSDPENKNVGETVQSRFLQKILDTMTNYDPAKKNTEEVHVRASIADNFEIIDQGPSHEVKRETDFDMTDLKQANPSFGPGFRAKLRASLGIPENKFAVSIYAKDAKNRNLKLSLVDLNAADLKPDIIFYTTGGKPLDAKELADFEAYSQPKNGGYKVILLSQVGSLTFKTFPKLLILNDLKGKVPYLHSVANLSIVEGPINFFEPLSVGTPTFWIPSTGYSDSKAYHEGRLNELKANATRTGIFASSDTGQDISNFYKSVRRRELSGPPEITEADGQRALDNILDGLSRVLTPVTGP